MAPPLNQSNWIYGISPEPMANYTDDTVNPASLLKFVTTDQQAADYQVNTTNNEGESTGTDWATEEDTASHDVNIPFSTNPSINMLRRQLRAGMGQVVTSSPSAGVSKDVYTPMDANVSRQLPAYWFGERCGSAHDALYPSCVLEKLTIKGEDVAKLNTSGNWRGSGQQILGAAVPINAETGKYYLKNLGAKIVRATAAVPATPVKTYQCGLQSFMLDIDNAPDQSLGYDPGCGRLFTPGDEDSGIIRAYHIFGRRKYSGEFVIWLENSAPELALLRNKAALNLKMGMYGKTIVTTYKNLFEVEMHLAKYDAVTLGNKNGSTTLVIRPKALYDEATNKIVSITVQYPTPA